jgi:hypothetical protein
MGREQERLTPVTKPGDQVAVCVAQHLGAERSQATAGFLCHRLFFTRRAIDADEIEEGLEKAFTISHGGAPLRVICRR